MCLYVLCMRMQVQCIHFIAFLSLPDISTHTHTVQWVMCFSPPAPPAPANTMRIRRFVILSNTSFMGARWWNPFSFLHMETWKWCAAAEAFSRMLPCAARIEPAGMPGPMPFIGKAQVRLCQNTIEVIYNVERWVDSDELTQISWLKKPRTQIYMTLSYIDPQARVLNYCYK